MDSGRLSVSDNSLKTNFGEFCNGQRVFSYATEHRLTSEHVSVKLAGFQFFPKTTAIFRQFQQLRLRLLSVSTEGCLASKLSKCDLS